VTALSYKPSLSMVLSHEGGYVNHPADPGGPTNNGITQRVYDAYRKLKGLPVQSVKLISSTEVADIYNRQYWKLMRGDDLPAGLDYAVFDFAVNSGTSRAIRYLQRLVGVNDDAVLGDDTLGAVYEAAKKNEEALIISYCANRLQFLKSLATFPTFGKGWCRRVIGNIAGVQKNDVGVVDAAVYMARADFTYILPAAIGTKPEELPAKAIAPEVDRDVFPLATPATLEELTKDNDMLAAVIALSMVN